MSEIEGARGAFESWLRRENGKWADKITERHADGRYCTLQAYMDWGAFQAGWLAALTSIDPETIRAEARAELAKKIVEWPEPGRFSSPYEGEAKTYWEIVEYCEAILTDDPKEREAEVGDIVAWVNSTGDVIFGQFGKEITQGDAVILVRRDVVERKLKEAEV